MSTTTTQKPVTTTPSVYGNYHLEIDLKVYHITLNKQINILDGFICDFEKDMCGWSQMTGSTVNWVRKTGKQFGGPKYDQLEFF